MVLCGWGYSRLTCVARLVFDRHTSEGWYPVASVVGGRHWTPACAGVTVRGMGAALCSCSSYQRRLVSSGVSGRWSPLDPGLRRGDGEGVCAVLCSCSSYQRRLVSSGVSGWWSPLDPGLRRGDGEGVGDALLLLSARHTSEGWYPVASVVGGRHWTPACAGVTVRGWVPCLLLLVIPAKAGIQWHQWSVVATGPRPAPG